MAAGFGRRITRLRGGHCLFLTHAHLCSTASLSVPGLRVLSCRRAELSMRQAALLVVYRADPSIDVAARSLFEFLGGAHLAGPSERIRPAPLASDLGSISLWRSFAQAGPPN